MWVILFFLQAKFYEIQRLNFLYQSFRTLPGTWISLRSLFQRYQVVSEATKFLDADLVIEPKNQLVLQPMILLVLEVISVVYVTLYLRWLNVLFGWLTEMEI